MIESSSTPLKQPVNPAEIVGKGGPAAGSAISIFGAVLVMIGFLLPWASCGNYRLSGLNIVTESINGDLADSGGQWLALIPFLAIGMVGISLMVIPASFWTKLPYLIKPVGSALVALLTVIACCPACMFYNQIQSPDNYGMLEIENGFWISMVGLTISFFGALLGVVTSIAEKVLASKRA